MRPGLWGFLGLLLAARVALAYDLSSEIHYESKTRSVNAAGHFCISRFEPGTWLILAHDKDVRLLVLGKLGKVVKDRLGIEILVVDTAPAPPRLVPFAERTITLGKKEIFKLSEDAPYHRIGADVTILPDCGNGQ